MRLCIAIQSVQCLDQKIPESPISQGALQVKVEAINLTKKDYYYCWTELFRSGKLRRHASNKERFKNPKLHLKLRLSYLYVVLLS